MSEDKFNSIIQNKVAGFVNTELCEKFFNHINYIKFKENTNCINVTKEFLERLSEDINSEIYSLIHSTILKQSNFDNLYLKNHKIQEKYENWDLYRSRIFSMIEDFLETNNTYNERFVDEYILDISNANRPTKKYFIKRFSEFKNKDGKTLTENISTYIINIIDIVFLDLNDESVFYSNLEEEVSSKEMDEYISLYKTIKKYQEKMICTEARNE